MGKTPPALDFYLKYNHIALIYSVLGELLVPFLLAFKRLA